MEAAAKRSATSETSARHGQHTAGTGTTVPERSRERSINNLVAPRVALVAALVASRPPTRVKPALRAAADALHLLSGAVEAWGVALMVSRQCPERASRAAVELTYGCSTLLRMLAEENALAIELLKVALGADPVGWASEVGMVDFHTSRLNLEVARKTLRAARGQRARSVDSTIAIALHGDEHLQERLERFALALDDGDLSVSALNLRHVYRGDPKARTRALGAAINSLSHAVGECLRDAEAANYAAEHAIEAGCLLYDLGIGLFDSLNEQGARS